MEIENEVAIIPTQVAIQVQRSQNYKSQSRQAMVKRRRFETDCKTSKPSQTISMDIVESSQHSAFDDIDSYVGLSAIY